MVEDGAPRLVSAKISMSTFVVFIKSLKCKSEGQSNLFLISLILELCLYS